MNKNAYYISVEETLELHRMLLEHFGGLPGVRDMGLLESAVFRPQSGYYTTLSVQAAALLQSFALNQAFLDGNKRVAFAAAAVFLNVNGCILVADPVEAERFIIQKVIQEKVTLEVITDWFESLMRKKN